MLLQNLLQYLFYDLADSAYLAVVILAAKYKVLVIGVQRLRPSCKNGVKAYLPVGKCTEAIQKLFVI